MKDSAARTYPWNPMERARTADEAFSDMQDWVNVSLRPRESALAQLGLDPMPDDPCGRAAPEAVIEAELRGSDLGGI
ncbi:MAG: hypothetical protein AAFR17_07090 [Pseudomonadota bacterium]